MPTVGERARRLDPELARPDGFSMWAAYFPERDTNGRLLGSEERRRALGIVMVSDPGKADFIAARKPEFFTSELLALGKLNLLWTQEPMHCLEFVPMIVREGRPIHIFNVFNHNVFTDDFYLLQPLAGRPGPIESEADLNVPFAGKTIAAMLTQRKYSIPFEGREYALSAQRLGFVTKAMRLGRMELHGRGWPSDIPVHGNSSRDADWRDIKLEVFGRHNFVFCPENCIADFYVTEKIWDAIRANCLPIYAGSRAIYASLPKDSFVDLLDFEGPTEALRFVRDMSFAEFRRRLNILKDVHRAAIASEVRHRSRERTFETVRRFLLAHLGPGRAAIAEG